MEKNFVNRIIDIEKDAINNIKELMKKYGIYHYELLRKEKIAYYSNDLHIDFVDSIGIDSGDETLVFYIGVENIKIITCDEIANGFISMFYEIIENEIKGFFDRMNKQNELVKQELKYSNKVFFLSDKYITKDLDNDDFAVKAFKYGKVMTLKEYTNLFNSFNLEDIHPDKGELRIFEFPDTIVELCPHCNCEVVITSEMKEHICPICNRKLLPCSLCDNCTDCPFDKK